MSETGITNPDISILPSLAQALSVDINTLFADTANEPKQIHFHELPDICYDSVLSLFLNAQWTLYFNGMKTEIDKSLKHRFEKLKNDLTKSAKRCAHMIDEGKDGHGAVVLSDAFTFIDRSYGGPESLSLFDIDRAGETLSVLGDKNVRRVLKAIYKRKIEGGENNTFVTPEQLADETGLPVETVNDAAVKLRHIRLLDETEELLEDGIKKEYVPLYYDDFVPIIAILRLAYFQSSDILKTTVMYRDADNSLNYSGDGLEQ